MIKLFEFLFSGCWHQWEDIDTKLVQNDDSIIVGAAVFCRCTKCGVHKRFNLY
jgi:hypothetical protein